MAACEHIYEFYDWKWRSHKCIAWNFLRRGYYQASRGIWFRENNLFELE